MSNTTSGALPLDAAKSVTVKTGSGGGIRPRTLYPHVRKAPITEVAISLERRFGTREQSQWNFDS
jgi:hypothetical protein